MGDFLGIPMCVEAVEGGVEVCRFDLNYVNEANEGYEVWEVNLSPALKMQALQGLTKDLEIGYGYLQLPYFVVRSLLGFVGINIQHWNNPMAGHGFICSQLACAYIIGLGRADLLVGYGKGSIAPGDLRKIMVAHPELFTLKATKL
jgi:hypothetical protein